METAVVREVGLRDGLQLVQTMLASDIKIEWCRLQAQAGFSEIEVTSFVPPSVIPQFADAVDVLAAANEFSGLRPSVLVPNLNGGIRALDHDARKITMVLTWTEGNRQYDIELVQWVTQPQPGLSTDTESEDDGTGTDPTAGDTKAPSTKPAPRGKN